MSPPAEQENQEQATDQEILESDRPLDTAHQDRPDQDDRGDRRPVHGAGTSAAAVTQNSVATTIPGPSAHTFRNRNISPATPFPFSPPRELTGFSGSRVAPSTDKRPEPSAGLGEDVDSAHGQRRRARQLEREGPSGADAGPVDAPLAAGLHVVVAVLDVAVTAIR